MKIRYGKENYEINITEQNKRVAMIPNNELEPIYYNIAGTKVLKQITGYITGSSSTQGISFHWNTDNLTFRVEVYSISEEEGLKIIESMING